MAARDTYIAAGLVGLVLVIAALVLSGIARLVDPPRTGDAAIAADAGPPAE